MPATPYSGQRTPSPLPPRAILEAQLAEDWRRLLGRAAVGRDDDFFDLGGESMAAVELLAILERRHGLRLALDALLPDLTVARLAGLLQQAAILCAAAGAPSGAGRSPLAALRPDGDRPPFVCVHPSGGSVLCYLDLARGLAANQPFYGLQGPDPRGSEEPYERIEEMAAAYLAALRAALPPRSGWARYRLGGYSFGGYVAFEMARQLVAAGEPPPLVALLDTRAPAARRSGDQPEGGLVADLAAVLERHELEDERPATAEEKRLWDDLAALAERHLGKVYERSAAGSDEAEAARSTAARRDRRPSRMGAIQRFFREYRFLPSGEEIGYAEVRRYLRFLRANFRSSRAYAPEPYDGAVLLIQGTDRLTAAEPPREVQAAGWSALVRGGLEVRAVPGHHLELLAAPAVAALAAEVGSWLEAGRRSERP